jgi:hypothetical protein
VGSDRAGGVGELTEIEQPIGGQSRDCDETRNLDEHAQHRAHCTAIGVCVSQHRLHAGTRQLACHANGDGGAAGGAGGTPHRNEATSGSLCTDLTVRIWS